MSHVQMPEAPKVATITVNKSASVGNTPAGVTARQSAVVISPVPSKTKLRTNIGMGGMTVIQSMNRNGSVVCAWRLLIFPIAHPSAPIRVNKNGKNAACSVRCHPTMDNPTMAITMLSRRNSVIRSLKNNAPSSTVNGADAWRTSEARPAGIPAAMPQYKKPNCSIPNPAPYPISQRHGTCGRGINNTVGIASRPNRIATKSSGG